MGPQLAGARSADGDVGVAAGGAFVDPLWASVLAEKSNAMAVVAMRFMRDPLSGALLGGLRPRTQDTTDGAMRCAGIMPAATAIKRKITR